MTEKKENRGGARPGAGRKPIFDLSEAKRREILADLDRVAKEKGTSIGQELSTLVFGRDKRNKIAGLKMVLSDVLPKHSERDVNVTKVTEPAVYLPEQKPDTDEAGDVPLH